MSFEAQKIYNDFPIKPIGFLCYCRFFFKFWREHEFVFTLPFRKSIDGFKPAMIYYDTGAKIHEYLKNVSNMRFAVTDSSSNWEKYFAHYHGVTRLLLDKTQEKNATKADNVRSFVFKRLKEVYNFDFKKFFM